MKKITVYLLLSIILFSCTGKKQNAQDTVDEIAAPLIADKLGDLNTLVAQIKDKNNSVQRPILLEKLRYQYPEYLAAVGQSEYVFTPEFDTAVVRQKNLIEKRCKQLAAEMVYKKALSHSLQQE